MRACLRKEGFEAQARPALVASKLLDQDGVDALICKLADKGHDLDPGSDLAAPVHALARTGHVEFSCADGALILTPMREDFEPMDVHKAPSLETPLKLSKFAYSQCENGQMIIRSPLADCILKIHDPRLLGFMACFHTPCTAQTAFEQTLPDIEKPEILAAFIRAKILLPCHDDETEEDKNPHLRMWDFHELLFHSRSRIGRSGFKIGATWELKDEIPQPPAIKENPWTEKTIPLYRPAVLSRDTSLFEAMETRRSIRNYSIVPLSSQELGEFLYRTMRIKAHHKADGIDIAPRPYPNGGGIWEQELYVTIDACVDIPRGVYYYDALNHCLCAVSDPSEDMEMLLQEASNATANTGRPQILFTIASRFSMFNWKYSAMAYAAQLKNVGVIYQTMYLVATAMGIGGCALGLGNSDRFAAITGLDYAEEGAIGEFMIGRPAFAFPPQINT